VSVLHRKQTLNKKKIKAVFLEIFVLKMTTLTDKSTELWI
jgi:hypothetical protein